MLVVEIEGGLGSQMFAYAAARRLGLVHGVDVHIDQRNYREYKKFDPELHHFAINANVLSNEEADEICGPNNERIPVIQPGHLHFDKSIVDVADPNVLMRGNYVSEDYFFDVTDILRTEFIRITQPTPYAQQLATTIGLIRQAGFEPVSVHIRRGDYANEAHIKDIYGLCSFDYYNNAMKLVSRVVERPCIANGSQPRSSGVQGMQIVKIIEAAERAMTSGRREEIQWGHQSSAARPERFGAQVNGSIPVR